MKRSREMTEEEDLLLTYLVNKSNLSLPDNWKKTLKVSPMNDGYMGSLYLIPNLHNQNKNERLFGRQVSDCRFKDADGIDVIASLYIDSSGELFELDIWKINYQPLIEIARVFHDVAYIE